MALMTMEQYLSTIRNLDHKVFIQGEAIESVVEHPISKPPAMATGATLPADGQL